VFFGTIYLLVETLSVSPLQIKAHAIVVVVCHFVNGVFWTRDSSGMARDGGSQAN
jgi:hypothetical protein